MNDSQRFLSDHTAEVEPLTLDYNRKYWKASLTGNGDDARASAAAKERLALVYARPDEFESVRRMAAAPGNDPLTARQLHLLSLEYGARQMNPEVLAGIIRREEEIDILFNSFRAVLDGGRVTENEIRHRLREENDIDRRKAAWEASKQIGDAVRDRLLELVVMRNREARRLGHRDYYAMSLQLQELDEAELFGTLDALESATAGPFRSLKADLDRTLADRFGLATREPWPWMYADPFFQEVPPGSGTIDMDGIYASADIEALTLRTFENLGLPLADLLPRSDLYEREGKCQHAFCTHIDRKDDVRVLCNVKRDEYWMTTMLHEFGHAAYDRFLDPELPFLLRMSAHTSTTEAVAMLMGRLTRNPDWLSRVAGIPPAEAARLRGEIARALRAQMLIFMRWGLLVVNFERQLYRDPEQDLNALWWAMASRYQHLAPPPGRDRPDWASKIHFSSAPVYYQNYILGELTASQLESAIRRHLPDQADERSFVDQPAAGAWLRKTVFEPGARRDWQETLMHATGEPLNPSHFMRQFVDLR
jgi:peptidyl-dipeptidase A